MKVYIETEKLPANSRETLRYALAYDRKEYVFVVDCYTDDEGQLKVAGFGGVGNTMASRHLKEMLATPSNAREILQNLKSKWLRKLRSANN